MNNYNYGNYGNYGNPYYQQTNQPSYYGQYQQQPVQQHQQQQVQTPNIIPMVYVNGLVGAKSYWMGTNQIAYLRDSEDDTILYEKKTDNLGKYYLKAFKLTEMELDNNGGFKAQNSQESINILNSKLDAIYAILAPKKEVKADESKQ